MAYTSGSSIDAEPSNDEIVRLTCLDLFSPAKAPNLAEFANL